MQREPVVRQRLRQVRLSTCRRVSPLRGWKTRHNGGYTLHHSFSLPTLHKENHPMRNQTDSLPKVLRQSVESGAIFIDWHWNLSIKTTKWRSRSNREKKYGNCSGLASKARRHLLIRVTDPKATKNNWWSRERRKSLTDLVTVRWISRQKTN